VFNVIIRFAILTVWVAQIVNRCRVSSMLWKVLWPCIKQVLGVCPSRIRSTGSLPLGICCTSFAIKPLSYADYV